MNPRIVDAWLTEFADTESGDFEIYVKLGRFQDLKEENAIMTAAGNSYGVMGGGIDLQIAKFFPKIEEYIRHCIQESCNGELMVGSSLYIPIYGYDNWEGLFYTPTMRAPSSIKGTDNVYKATYATLIRIGMIKNIQANISTLVMPGFGGNCGQVPPRSIARQMRLAIENYFGGNKGSGALFMNYNHARILEAVNLK